MLKESTVAAFQKEFNTMVEDLAKKHGMTYVPGRFTYYSEDGLIKAPVVFGEIATTGGINPIYLQDIQKFGFLHGFTKDDVNTLTFSGRGETFTVIGMKGKNKIAANDSKGKTLLYNAADIARITKRKSPRTFEFTA